ncbi:hypothetical protein [Colwellia sp. MB02u-9]|uniref:hypothetical protein n=1 Tax=Colwellia sp. MB02u-9 TaxID=2759823 RepID=UPI0015F58EBD|nr:hypothetical protein [Colwellia sp. MB02u-9]MBA6294554.1 hypothetical protein [Colwellia sp. MB02u-9]
MRTFKTVTTQELTTVVCDGCGLQASADSDYEFLSIAHHCGYGSIHGDGKQIEIDLCQQCFADMCGDTLRVTDESNTLTEYSESSDKEQLEYSNIFDVIYLSKTKAGQLKDNCDLRLAVRELLLKNKITNNNGLTVALKRVEQLWDAQYQSAEGNELHQLADIICAYENKGWSSFFEEAPIADDDFMPGRLSFESKFACDEEQTASGMLSNIPVNTEINDESSRDSALMESNIDDVKSHLLMSIAIVMAKYPELRLGQLLVNAMSLQQLSPEIYHDENTELFYVEDNILAEKLKQLSKV